MRWLLVSDGRSIHTRRLALALCDAGHEVHAACFESEDEIGVEVHHLPFANTRDARYVLAAPALRRLVKRMRPDVLNAHYLSSYGLLGALAGHRFLVQTTWGTDVLVTARQPLRRPLARFALKRARLATGDSTSLLDGITSLAPNTPRHHFVFGPPISLFADQVAKEDLVVSVRSHEPLYRIDRILEAWELARERLDGYRIVVVGDGSATPQLRRMAGPAVEFRGRVDHRQLLNLVARARLMVTIPDSDATSAALLEALAARCSAVASDLPANREWLPEDRLVPVNPDAGLLADTIVRVVDRPLILDRQWSIEQQVEQLTAAVAERLR